VPLMLALRKVGNQWSLLVLSELLEGPRRFSEIQTAVPKISGKSLSRVLAKLQADGLIRREVTPTRPPQVIYSLIHKDPALREAIEALSKWGRNQKSRRAK
jgi:DNA-binding HxlR family transcriptional regulator